MCLRKAFQSVGALATAFLLVGCASVKTTVQSSPLAQPSRRIAVLPFKGDLHFGEQMSSALVSELLGHGFVVVERAELMSVINEQGLQYTGAMDPGTMTENGKLCGADFIVIGSVQTRQVVPPIDWVLGTGGAVTEVDSVSIRWISVRSGQIVAAARIRNGRFGGLDGLAARIVATIDGAIRTGDRLARGPLPQV